MSTNKKEESIYLFLEQGLSKSEISRKLEVPRTTIRRWLLDVAYEKHVHDKEDTSDVEVEIDHFPSEAEILKDRVKHGSAPAAPRRTHSPAHCMPPRRPWDGDTRRQNDSREGGRKT